KARRQLERSLYSQLETVEGQASKLGYYELLGDYRLAEAHQNAIRKVTAEQVMFVAGRYFKLKNCSLVAYLPRQQDASPATESQVAGALKTRLKDVARRKTAPAEQTEKAGTTQAKSGSAARVDSTAATEKTVLVRLDNGVRVLVRRRPMIPLVSMLTMFKAGARLEKKGESGLSLLALRSLIKGSRSHHWEDIANKIEGFGGSIDSFSGFDTAGVSINILSRHLENVLPIYEDIVHQALYAESMVQKEKDKIAEEIAERKDTPFQYGMDNLFSNVFGDHPYSHPFLGREEDVRQLTSAKCKSWHKRMVVPENIVACFVGDITEEKAIELANRLYGHLARRPVPLPEGPAPGDAVHPGMHELSRPNFKQSVALVGFTAPVMMSEEAISLEVLNGILSGLGGRLFVELRDKRSLGYMTGAAFLPLKERSIFFGYANPAVEGIDEALEVIQRELDLVVREKVSDAELVRAKSWLTGSLIMKYQRNYAKAYSYAAYEILDFGYEVIDRLPQIIQRVTKEDILAAAGNVFHKDKAVLIKLIPEP
ncbi:MAG: insulinase family protein, partial [Candidatus Latescibacterota bacterium]